MRIAKDEYPDLPFILYGHSMGGLISSVAIMNDKPQLDGLILSAPALKVKTNGPVYYKTDSD
jgi:acylglycerol lipase